MLDELLATYDTVTETAMRAAAALDQLVLTLNPQPTTLITLRTTAPLTCRIASVCLSAYSCGAWHILSKLDV